MMIFEIYHLCYAFNIKFGIVRIKLAVNSFITTELLRRVIFLLA